MAEKEATERRVYVLPSELVERIRAFQEAHSIPSEVEAARRLLDSALQMRDTVQTILDKLLDRMKGEKDLRMLARDVLTTHPLVRSLRVDHNGLTFTMEGGADGRIDHNLKAWINDSEFANEDWQPYPPPKPSPAERRPVRGAAHVDLDDDIPF